MAQIGQRALDSGITPKRINLRHLDDEFGDVTEDG